MDLAPRLHGLRRNAAALGAALRTRGLWRGTFLVAAGVMAAQIAVWELDLGGWRRDGLLCLPIVVAMPWAEARWPKLLASRLRERP